LSRVHFSHVTTFEALPEQRDLVELAVACDIGVALLSSENPIPGNLLLLESNISPAADVQQPANPIRRSGCSQSGTFSPVSSNVRFLNPSAPALLVGNSRVLLVSNRHLTFVKTR
jgi:hypothetical protein